MAELSWPEWAEKIAAGAIIFIPIGATEQHGPNLPLNVDVILPTAVCERVARLTGGIVAPKIREFLASLAKRGHIAGLDLVETAQDYGPAGVTAIVAAQLLLNLLGRMFV